MNLQSLFQDFNPSKFVVHCCLFTFTILFCLRLDGYIGAIIWCRFPHYRVEGDSYSHFKAMLISLSLHLILLMFELLACDRLTSGRHLWVLVFIPLIFGSAASVGACVWAVKHDRSFELELFCAVNALQFVFLPLKLDELVSWSWEVVFVPLWIVLCLSLVAVLYSIIFSVILLRTPEVSAQQKKSAFYSAIGNCATVIPVLVFQVLLADKLDKDLDWPFIAVAGPLLVALFTLILLSFNAKGGNKWWFGIRKNFSQFLLGVLPCLQEYGNISYHTESGQTVPLDSTNLHLEEFEKYDKKSKKALTKKSDHLKPVVPIVSIELPD
ncbi:transmembrane protein 185B isoform X2 [Anopheles ziemanni]|uniref:transmembrane protein 185B isoform X2 n=1 Tax=Anopheles coustani TaxID=139045 RepID=UPI00265B0805|nr:transmembrane protein 185B isoform X2 [Anopheles coustani]XP_058171694.1 transmembrane protein 185B isoform X2 [Anopheles ziemanni]